MARHRDGNSSFIGIEVENSGSANDPWPPEQLDACQRGVAAILRHVGQSAGFCCGHKEYALPTGRKDDPHLSMADFRAAVAAILGGAAPIVELIPAAEPSGAKRPTLRRGDTGKDVEVLQTKLKVPAPNGIFGPKTEAAVREFQRTQGVTPDGIIGPKSWAVIDKL